jgi:hypothetical protein
LGSGSSIISLVIGGGPILDRSGCAIFFDWVSSDSAVILPLPFVEEGTGAGLMTGFSAGGALAFVVWFSDVVDGFFAMAVVFEFVI